MTDGELLERLKAALAEPCVAVRLVHIEHGGCADFDVLDLLRLVKHVDVLEMTAKQAEIWREGNSKLAEKLCRVTTSYENRIEALARVAETFRKIIEDGHPCGSEAADEWFAIGCRSLHALDQEGA
jgi:hypothetical protein